MAESAELTEKPGPLIGTEVHEVQAVFGSDAALQDAMGRLASAGFDHADFSLPIARPEPGEATPEQGAGSPFSEDDNQSMRTMHTSMAGAVGALAAAGATVMTGGAAGVALAAAAAAGTGAGLLAHSASAASDTAQHEAREQAAARDELVLSVRTPDLERRRRAEAVLREAGAIRVEPVTRTTADVASGIDSSSWTG
jgi:hypothetical protein